jgi:hypothetical protein
MLHDSPQYHGQLNTLPVSHRKKAGTPMVLVWSSRDARQHSLEINLLTRWQKLLETVDVVLQRVDFVDDGVVGQEAKRLTGRHVHARLAIYPDNGKSNLAKNQFQRHS